MKTLQTILAPRVNPTRALAKRSAKANGRLTAKDVAKTLDNGAPPVVKTTPVVKTLETLVTSKEPSGHGQRLEVVTAFGKALGVDTGWARHNAIMAIKLGAVSAKAGKISASASMDAESSRWAEARLLVAGYGDDEFKQFRAVLRAYLGVRAAFGGERK